MSLSRPVWRSDYANSRQLSALETFSRGSTAMRTNRLGALAAVAANQLRVDFDPTTLACRGALLELGATNLLTQSEFANGVTDAPTRGGLVSATTFAGFAAGLVFGYDGTNNSYAYKSATVTSGAAYVFSAFVRMDDGGAPTFGSATPASVLNDFYFVAVGRSTLAPTSYVVDYFGGGLYRVSISTTAASAGAQNVGIAKNGTNSSRTFKVTGYQIEAGAVPTSYIPTTTAAVTRAADQLSIAGADFTRVWRPDEGTVVARGRFGTYSVAQVVFVANDGTNNNRIMVLRSGDATTLQALVTVGGVAVANQSIAGVVSDNANFAIAFSYKAGALQVALNGTLLVSLTPASIPALTQLQLGNQNGFNYLAGHLASMEVHARAATAAELVELTR